MNALTHIDPGALERLRRLGGEKFLHDMIGLFLDYAAKKVAEATEAAAAGDLARVQSAVHPIKSSAGNIGALGMQALASRIETEAGTGAADAVALGLTELRQTFASVAAELRTLNPSGPTTAP